MSYTAENGDDSLVTIDGGTTDTARTPAGAGTDTVWQDMNFSLSYWNTT
jgi:hypothetical protein